VRILVDECCPPGVVEALRQDGHEVLYIAAEMSSLTDADSLRRSVDGQQIIVTENRDFCELGFRDAKPAYGIVPVRIDHRHPQEKADRVLCLFTAHTADLPHSITTLARTNVRTRPLPKPPEAG
jgi:predicted nuclease of predicted toxin-antitoxin system